MLLRKFIATILFLSFATLPSSYAATFKFFYGSIYKSGHVIDNWSSVQKITLVGGQYDRDFGQGEGPFVAIEGANDTCIVNRSALEKMNMSFYELVTFLNSGPKAAITCQIFNLEERDNKRPHVADSITLSFSN